MEIHTFLNDANIDIMIHIYITLQTFYDKFAPIYKMVCSFQGVGGSVQYPKNFLKRAYDLVREKGGICIADEVRLSTYLIIFQNLRIHTLLTSMRGCDEGGVGNFYKGLKDVPHVL